MATSSEPPELSEDHRTRVGAARRLKTRMRLIETALAVFAKKGPDEPVIEDFIAAAQVSRGTFYNYFSTTAELLAAVAGTMSDEVLQVVDPIVQRLEDPAERICTGSRLYMGMALRYPIWGAFITRVGTSNTVRGRLMDTYLSRDIMTGIDSGRLRVRDVAVARDLVLGSIFYGIETMLTEPTRDNHSQEIMASVLLGLGLDDDESQRIAHMPLGDPGNVTAPIFAKLDKFSKSSSR